MAFLATGSSNSQPSSSNTPQLERSNSNTELLALQQQLLASMQQNGLMTNAQGLATSHLNSSSVPNNSEHLYQQLLLRQFQQSQSLHISPTSDSVQSPQTSPNDLVQQLASTLLVNPSIGTLQPQLSSMVQTQSPTQNVNQMSNNLLNLQNLMSSSSTVLNNSLNNDLLARQGLNQTNLANLLLQQQQSQRIGNSQANVNQILQLVQSNPLLASQLPQLLLQNQQTNNSNLALLSQLAGQQEQQANLNDMNQLALLLAQTEGPSTQSPQAESSKPQNSYEEILRRQQDNQKHLAAAMASVQQRQPRLSTQNSSNSLLGGQRSTDSPGSSSQIMELSSGNKVGIPPSRQASSDRLLSGAESVQDHISRLISENEAIVEPNPVLLKRRPYHRQSTSNSITSQTSEINGPSSQRDSPGLFHQVPNHRLPTTRSQSMHESQMLSHVHKMNNITSGSLTSGQPIVRQVPQTCNFCSLKFPNEAGLKAHDFRCSKKEQVQKRILLQKQQSQPQLQWHNSALLNAQPQFLLLQNKLLAQHQHQSTIAALVGGGAGVAPELLGSTILSGRSSVPISSNGVSKAGTSNIATASPPLSSKNGTSSPSTSSTCSENRHPLKKRLLESVARHSSDLDLTSHTPGTPTSIGSVMDCQEMQQSPAKMAKLDQSLFDLLHLNQLTTPQTSDPPLSLNSIVSSLCPTEMRESIMYANSYIDAQISAKMPYLVTLDQNMVVPEEETSFWLKQPTPPRNVTAEKSAVLKVVCCPKIMSSGASNYIDSSMQVNDVNSNPTPVFKAAEVKPKESEVQLDVDTVSTSITVTQPEEFEEEEMPEEEMPQLMDFKPMKQRPDEVEVYVRGRGRGRYVCERCGIRCKKPSMLKKHLKSHTNVRPFSCITCNFAFKTKGNLTKHLFSKTHRVKVASLRGDSGVEENSLRTCTLESADAMKLSVLESRFVNDEFDNKNDDCESDNEDDGEFNAPLPPCSGAIAYRRFGQENILFERTAHTPPTVWLRGLESNTSWPNPDDPSRNCHSAPPACSSSPPKKKLRQVHDQLPSAEFNVLGALVQMNKPIEMEDAERQNPKNCMGYPLQGPTDSTLLSGNVLFSLDNLKQINSTSVGEFLATECRSFYCEMCERKFRKESELNLHKQTHLIEQQNARSRAYQCLECKTVHRSRAVLLKHMEAAHGRTDLNLEVDLQKPSTLPSEEVLDSESANGDKSQQTNLRKYYCSDCDVGFRTHGVLAKHLRSKSHVKVLSSQKKLPEDALILLKDHSIQLANIDASDCVQARKTLMKLLDSLRSKSHQKNNMEASEGLKIGISEQSLNAVKIQNLRSESNSPLQRLRTDSLTSLKEVHDVVTPSVTSMTSDSVSPPKFSSQMGSCIPFNGQSITANMWMPPKLTQVEEKEVHEASESGETSYTMAMIVLVMRSVEETSDSTGRSESSTPVQRTSVHPTSSNGFCVTSTSSNTVCDICDVEKTSAAELQVHLLADHCTKRDGTDFKCLERSCDKVFSNKSTLRTHLFTHFSRNSVNTGREESTLSLDSQFVENKIAQKKNSMSVPVQNGPDASVIGISDRPKKLKEPSAAATISLPCSHCGQQFDDAFKLQQHWVEHMTQLNSRPHVCKECDAGFTTFEALKSHKNTHR